MCGIGITPMFVSDAGNPPSELFGSRICAIPRYSVSVPIVTASDGRPTRVTSSPLKRPSSPPHTSVMAIDAQMLRPCEVRSARIVPESPSVDATERSISPVITISASGSAMIATSPTLRPR